MKKKNRDKVKKFLILALLLVFTVTAFDWDGISKWSANLTEALEDRAVSESDGSVPKVLASETEMDWEAIPEYSGSPYVEINENNPDFSEEDLITDSFETYSELDSLGRCGTAFANLGADLMPTEERGDISEIHPSGWHSVQYEGIDGESLYNRCHLIAYKLTAENANERNLITGTRYLNVEGMLPFEDLVANYIYETGNHVLYRVTPVFEGDNLIASGVQMEALSVEDEGEGVRFNVYCYNVQPGIGIDYATGESWIEDAGLLADSGRPSDGESDETAYSSDSGIAESELAEDSAADSGTDDTGGTTYVLNTNTMRFHYPDCFSVSQMSESNKKIVTSDRETLIAEGYTPCGNCRP